MKFTAPAITQIKPNKTKKKEETPKVIQNDKCKTNIAGAKGGIYKWLNICIISNLK